MTISRVAISGNAGFIGSWVTRKMLAEGCAVHGLDNFRTGRREFLPDDTNLTQWDADITTDHDALMAWADGCDWVIHLAANPDARGERRGVQFNLQQNIIGTANVLDAMHHVGTSRILYASSASVYGMTRESPVREDCAFPVQASFYGASKLAGEGLVGAYCSEYGFTGINARWVHILGERYLHGHIIDFIRKLRRDSTQLLILGDGRQAKSGLHAANLADGLWTAMCHHDMESGTGCHAYNFGGDTLLTVEDSAKLICQKLGVDPVFEFSGRKDGGWVGDNPSLVLDSSKIRTLGWKPTVSVPEGIAATVDWLTSSQCNYL